MPLQYYLSKQKRQNMSLLNLTIRFFDLCFINLETTLADCPRNLGATKGQQSNSNLFTSKTEQTAAYIYHLIYHFLNPNWFKFNNISYFPFRFQLPFKVHQFSSVQFSHSVVSDSLQPHESQHARPPCPSPTPGVYSNSSPLSQRCHPAISSSVIPFSSCPQALPASGSFPMSQLFT